MREAINDFTKASSLDSDAENPGIYDGIGQCYHAQRKFEEAIYEYDSAIDKDPTNVEFLKNRAQCYFDMSQHDKANEDLQ